MFKFAKQRNKIRHDVQHVKVVRASEGRQERYSKDGGGILGSTQPEKPKRILCGKNMEEVE